MDLTLVVQQKTDILRRLGYTTLKTARRKSQLTFFLFGPNLSFLKPYLPLKMVGKHHCTDWTKFISLCQLSACMNLIFQERTVKAGLSVEK